MDNNITRTIYGATVQANLLMGLVQSYPEFTTINQHLNIQKDTLPGVNDKPNLGCYIWGNRGHTIEVAADGFPLNAVVQHRATDAGLFNQLPFVLREVNLDLTVAERNKYCLRILKEVGGINYFAYYGRRIDKTNLVTNQLYTQIIDGVARTDPFVAKQSNLTPDPQQLSNTATNLLNADYVSAKVRMELILNEFDVAEMLNVAKVMWNDERRAIISEIGLCTNVDKVINAQGSQGGSFQYNEAIGVQIAAHVATYNSLITSNTGVKIAMNVGLNEPLYALSTTDGSATGPGTIVTP